MLETLSLIAKIGECRKTKLGKIDSLYQFNQHFMFSFFVSSVLGLILCLQLVLVFLLGKEGNRKI